MASFEVQPRLQTGVPFLPWQISEEWDLCFPCCDFSGIGSRKRRWGDFACAYISDLAIIYSLFRMTPATQASFKVSRREGDIDAGVGLRTNLGSCARVVEGGSSAKSTC